MGGQNGKPKVLNEVSVEPNTGSSQIDSLRMAPHQSSVQKPNFEWEQESFQPTDGNTKSCSEATNRTNGEDLDSLIEFLESDQVDSDLKESGQRSTTKNSDLDELVEMLERDVVPSLNQDAVNAGPDSRRSPRVTPIDTSVLPSTPYKEFNISPLPTERSGKDQNCEGLLHGDSDLEEWAGLLEDNNLGTKISKNPA